MADLASHWTLVASQAPCWERRRWLPCALCVPKLASWPTFKHPPLPTLLSNDCPQGQPLPIEDRSQRCTILLLLLLCPSCPLLHNVSTCQLVVAKSSGPRPGSINLHYPPACHSPPNRQNLWPPVIAGICLVAPKFVVQNEIETGRRLAQASPQLLHCEHCSEDDEDDDYDQIVDEVAEHEDNGDRGDDQDGHGDENDDDNDIHGCNLEHVSLAFPMSALWLPPCPHRPTQVQPTSNPHTTKPLLTVPLNPTKCQLSTFTEC